MRICIYGAGSLGSALGGILAEKNEVVLVGRREHVRAVQKRGLKIVGDINRTIRLEARESLVGLTPPELLVITTKAYDTSGAVRALRGWASDEMVVLTLQNGLGNLEQIRAWKGDMAFGGTTTMGAALNGPGVVKLSGIGGTTIGSDLNPSEARKIVSAFSASGLPTQSIRDVVKEIWTKAIMNASINPISAVLRVKNGRLVESRAIKRLMTEVCDECLRASITSGIRLSYNPLHRRIFAVCRDTSENKSSMLQDIERGRRTEIDQINGAFCSLGDDVGVSTPLNDALVAMIGSLADSTRPEKG